jgi:hypothetical protein
VWIQANRDTNAYQDTDTSGGFHANTRGGGCRSEYAYTHGDLYT